jgi:sirohydrochlorin ferrochelatase
LSYERVISFDHALRHLPNFFEASLPCWSPKFELRNNTARSGYAMISENKWLDQSKIQKDLYAGRRKVISKLFLSDGMIFTYIAQAGICHHLF